MSDCLDRTVSKELTMSGPMTRAWIHRLARLGELEYYGHFPRPFFRLTRRSAWVLKGVEGNLQCQVLFLDYSETAEADLIERLNTIAGNPVAPGD